MTTETFLNKEQMAERLGVTIRTLDNWVRARKIPVIHVTKRSVRFRMADVIEALGKKTTHEA